ncbi:MAG: hypothetical protein ACKVKR_16615 [Pseudomonadales bacterium]|tara:strand:- start:451 stop:762 length:312 start_codon:yes stop_codon:yes gene_type:complete
MYGHQWASQQGDEPNDTWIRGLDGLSNEQFGTGLRALLGRADTWPPNLIEFRKLCTGYDGHGWARQSHKIIDSTAKIEDLGDKEKRKAEGLERIRNLIESIEL